MSAARRSMVVRRMEVLGRQWTAASAARWWWAATSTARRRRGWRDGYGRRWADRGLAMGAVAVGQWGGNSGRQSRWWLICYLGTSPPLFFSQLNSKICDPRCDRNLVAKFLINTFSKYFENWPCSNRMQSRKTSNRTSRLQNCGHYVVTNNSE